MSRHIVILGTAYPYRGGGIATFNERLASEFEQQGYEVTIFNFTLQYPSFMFPGKTQYVPEGTPPPALKIKRKVNSINPLNWLMVGNELRRLKPDLIVVRFWLPLIGPALGTIVRRAKQNSHTRVIAITDNVIPHEKRVGDKSFTKYFLHSCDAFITMSEKVMADLRSFEPHKPIKQAAHPLYDNFGHGVSKPEARARLNLPPDQKILLFFGFIRKYKGLDILFEAIQLLKDKSVKLLVAGEFYDDEKTYLRQIETLGIQEQLILRTDFVPDELVKYYFGAADVVIQPYRNATQSGVTPLAYHFEKPMIVTNVGALPAYVPNGTVGIVTEPTAPSIATAIESYFALGEQYFIPQLRVEKEKYSWKTLVSSIMELADKIPG